MKRSSILIGVGAIGILCGGIFLGGAMKSDGGAGDPASGAAEGGTAERNSAPRSTLSSRNQNATKSSNSRESSWARLTEKYGDSRTNLSKKVTEDISKMLSDAMDLTDMGAKLAGGKSASEMAADQATNSLTRQLGLTDEQKAQAAEIVGKRVSERFEAMRELSSAMNEDPSAMMETILAGDAYSRGEITEDEYTAITGETVGLLRNVAGFGLGGGRGGSDLSDPILAAELQPVLNAEQQQKLADLTAQAQARSEGRNQGGIPFQDGKLPAMDLEQLDASVQSAQKLTGGLRAMMEGFSELRNVTPPATGE